MPVTFRSRLFRLLLLFAAIPSLLITLIGYYLVFEDAPDGSGADSGTTAEPTAYLTDLLYRDIEAALQDDSDLARQQLDLVVEIDNGDTALLTRTGRQEPPELIATLLEASDQRDRGLLSFEGSYIQYLRRPSEDGRDRIGGIFHDSAFAQLVEGSRRASAESTARQELRTQYAVFLGLFLLSVTAVTVVAAYVLSSQVSRKLAEPVTALSRASRQIAAGDFSPAVHTAAEGEIGQLITNFNRMARQLDRMTERLSQTERVAAWRQIARNFAHELKNPLQPILISLHRLEKKLEGTEVWSQVESPLRSAREEVQHLTVLAERFSSLAKLPPPRIEPTDLKALVESTVELYRDRLAEFSFNLEAPADPIVMDTDTGYLREALHNLIQNAIDASAPGGSIKISLEADSEQVTISVVDTGTGMDAQTLSSARLPYYTTKTKGNGLGLAIVDRSMSELGGQLKVESAVGSGTRVTLWLPIDRK